MHDPADAGPPVTGQPVTGPSVTGPPETAVLCRLLAGLVAGHAGGRITLGEVQHALGDRSLAALLLLVASPTILPLPPGTTTVTGVPLILLSIQMMLGYPHARLPGWITRRGINGALIAGVLPRLGRFEERAMRLLHPRLPVLVSPAMVRLAGAASLVLSIVLWLPIPLGNNLPALSISILALAVLTRDGLAMLAGWACAVFSLVVVSGVMWAAVHAALLLVPRLIAWF
jgi:hypothetical protein